MHLMTEAILAAAIAVPQREIERSPQ
jgi:hypothetical protein